jgi:hypothetical protein
MAGVTEVEPGLGQEAVEEAWPVLHPPDPGLHQRGQLADVVLARLAEDRFGCDQTASTGFSSGAYGGSRKTVSQERAAIAAWKEPGSPDEDRAICACPCPPYLSLGVGFKTAAWRSCSAADCAVRW